MDKQRYTDRYPERREQAKDAKRFRTLFALNPGVLASIAYSIDAACEFGDPLQAIDAAVAHVPRRSPP